MLEINNNKSIEIESEMMDEELVDGKADYPDGGVYEGMMKGEKRHGNGTMLFANSDRYDGEWFDDEMHG